MIINLLLNGLVMLVGSLFVFLPTVTIASIPYIGSSIATNFATMVSYWNGFLLTFPYAQLPWHIFLYVILPLELTLLFVKFILGHRTPINTN